MERRKTEIVIRLLIRHMGFIITLEISFNLCDAAEMCILNRDTQQNIEFLVVQQKGHIYCDTSVHHFTHMFITIGKEKTLCVDGDQLGA